MCGVCTLEPFSAKSGGIQLLGEELFVGHFRLGLQTQGAKTSQGRLNCVICLCSFVGSPWDWQSGNVRVPSSSSSSSGGFGLDDDTSYVSSYPSIDLEVSANLTAFVGETAVLGCRVTNLGEYTVSWLRGRDMSVISVGDLTFSSDRRFRVVRIPRPRISASDWNLEVCTT